MANAWTLLVRIQADARQMEYALSSVERRLGGFAGAIGGAGRTMSAAGRAMTIGITAPILAMGGAVIKAAADWETAFTSIEKVLSEADLQSAHMTFEQLEEDIRKLATVIPVDGGVNALAQVAAQGGALGIAAARITEFTEVVAKLNQTADDVTMDAAARSLGHLNTVMNFSEGEMLALADAVVHLGNNGASTEGEILNMTSAISGAAAIAKIGQEETVAWAAAMANIGEKAQAGGSSLSRFFQNMHGFITEATPELTTIADVLGTTEEAVQRAFGEDSSQVLQDFLVELSKTPDKWISTLTEIGLGDLLRRRAFTRFLEAIRSGSTGSIVAMMNELSQAGGAMNEEFAKRVDTLNAKLQIIGQRLYEAAITAGETLIPIFEEHFLPVIDEIVVEVQKLAEWFSALPDDTKKTVAQVALLVAAAGPLLFVFGGVLQFVSLIASVLTGVQRALGGIIGGLGGIGRALPGGGQGTVSRIMAQPVFVTNWPPGMLAPGGPGGGPLAGPAGRGGRGFSLTRFLEGAFIVGGAAWVADMLEEPSEELAFALHDELLKDNPLAGVSMNDLQWPFGPKNTPTILPEIFGGNGLLGGTPEIPTATPEEADAWAGMYDFSNSTEKLADAAASFDQNLTQHFAPALPKLATNEVIQSLARTTEMGLEGVGTSFQEGIKTGMDPLGDIATRILARAEDPKAPAVMAEIEGHLLGLEEIQQTYLDQGDIHLAAKVQANIDTLNTLIGREDEHRAVTEKLAANAASSDRAMLQTAKTQTDAINSGASRTSGRVDALSGITAWWFSIVNGALNRINGTISAGRLVSTNVYMNGRWVDSISTLTPGLHSGTWNTGPGGLAFLHPNEMVVPEKDAAPFRRGDFWDKMQGEGQRGDIYHVELAGLLPARSVRDIGSELKELVEGRLVTKRRMTHERSVTLGGGG